MMYKTDIANMALGRLGISSTITDLESDISTEAQILKRHFRLSLDYLLEQHQWNFARKTIALSKQFDNPEPSWAFSYNMPADCLVIRQIAYNGNFIQSVEMHPGDKIPFTEVVVGGVPLIYTNLSNAHAEYTRRIEENGAFPNHFGRALSAQLSMDIAPSLITSNYVKIKASLNEDAFNDVAAGIADDLARQPQFTEADSPFIKARHRS